MRGARSRTPRARLLSKSTQRCELSLVPDDPVGIAELASERGTAQVCGDSSTSAIRTELVLERARATLKLAPPDALTITDARAASVAQLEAAARLGLFQSTDTGVTIFDRFLAATRDELIAGVSGPGYSLRSVHFRGTEPRALELSALDAFAPAAWHDLWRNGPVSLTVSLCGFSAVADAVEIWNRAGDDAIATASVELTCEEGVDALVELDWPEPCALWWHCGFDDYGSAYHGVGVALHGRYQDGRVLDASPGRHQLVVLVDAKRSDAERVIARVSARSGIALVRDGGGL